MNNPTALSAPVRKLHWIDNDDPVAVRQLSELCFGPDALAERDIYDFMDTADCIPMVLHVDGAFAGYNFYRLHEHCVQIFQIAVVPALRRQGHGSYMLNSLIAELHRLRRRMIMIRFPDSCLGGGITCLTRCRFVPHKPKHVQPQDNHTHVLKYIAPRRLR